MAPARTTWSVAGRALCALLWLAQARARVETPWTDFAHFNLGRWHGRAISIDPVTAAPRSSEKRFTLTHAEAGQPCTYSTSAALLDDDRRSCAFETTFDERADVDLDGSYSNDHAAGCDFAALLSDLADASSAFVIEHSIACSDDERVRLLLLYGAPAADADEDAARALEQPRQALLDVLLLREARQAEGATDAELKLSAGAAPCTLDSLLGEWRGDACVRQPIEEPPAQAAPRGFGARGKAAGGKGLAGGEQTGFGRVAVNIYKASVEYMWDGDTLVGRRLGFAAFNGEELESIVSTGALKATEGQLGTHEAVAFGRGFDPTAPRMLLLPHSCFVLAPSLAVEGASFATEFGVLLEGGESFGMMGFVEGADGGGLSEGGPFGEAGGDPTAARMVRVLRLYKPGRKFASGTTSLCSATRLAD